MSHETKIEAALFHQLVGDAAIPLVGSVVGSLLVTAALIVPGYDPLAVAWFCLIIGTTAIRSWFVRRCRRDMGRALDHRAAVRYAMTVGLSGAAWGLGGLLVIHAPPLAMVVIITAIQAMVMGGALTLGCFLPAFLAFSLPAMLPMILALLWLGGSSHAALAAYSAIFLGLMLVIARRYNRTLRRTLQLTFEKEDLVSALTEAHDRQSALAVTDALTGIANRRRFDEMLTQEFARLRRSGGHLSLLLLDVDHFKAFNDTYGHVAGDRCLKGIAEVLSRNLHRAMDLAARYGGEEFIAILPETDHDGVVALAEKVRKDVELLAIVHSNSPTAPHVTVSIGVVTLKCADISRVSDAVAMADRELYRAKDAGRNRVVAANGVARDRAGQART